MKIYPLLLVRNTIERNKALHNTFKNESCTNANMYTFFCSIILNDCNRSWNLLWNFLKWNNLYRYRISHGNI